MCVTAEQLAPPLTSNLSSGRLVLIEGIQLCFFRQAYRLVLGRQKPLFTLSLPGRPTFSCRGLGVPDLVVENLRDHANPWGEIINLTLNEQRRFEEKRGTWPFHSKLFLINQHTACWLFCCGELESHWSMEGLSRRDLSHL